jgi:hypothetical protein
MAARRLLVVMLVLLGISTLAAAFIPTESADDEQTESTASESTEAQAPDPLPEGELLPPVRIEVGGKTLPVVRLDLGDQIELVITSRRTDLLEIPAIGVVEPITPDRPTRIDFLARNTGSFGIRMIEADRVVARIEVGKARREAEGDDG